MADFKISNQDFYLRQGVQRTSDASLDLLLSYLIIEPTAIETATFTCYAFIESHKTKHDVWQIVARRDRDDFEAEEEEDTAIADYDEDDEDGQESDFIADHAERILCRPQQAPSLRAGRLFTISGAKRSEALIDKVIDILVRARWPYQDADECLSEGLVSAVRWQTALDAFSAERIRHADEAKRCVADAPSVVIDAARRLGLHPEPTETHPNQWQAACPGRNHPLFISASEEQWFCGWCKRKGGAEKLEEFCAERKHPPTEPAAG